MFVTITGFNNYYKQKPFAIGNVLMCSKDFNNTHDQDAIKVTLPVIGTVGYIANSIDTVAGGTYSASRVYEKVPDNFYIKVRFTTFTKIICEILEGNDEELQEIIRNQFSF